MTDGALGSHTKSEILSQPQVWGATLEGLADFVSVESLNLSSYEQILFTGCGSTYYLSQWAARQCQETVGVLAHAVPASELMLFPSAWLRTGTHTLLVAASRSAETTETVRAVESFQANYQGDTLCVTCYPDRRLAQLTRWVLAAPAAQEESIAQTRSFSSMAVLIAWLLDGKPASVVENELPSLGSTLIERYQHLAEEIGRDTSLQRFFFLGSGKLYGLACEAMLKMKEMSLSYSEAYHFLEFRHGPMSMIDEQSLVVGLLSDEGADFELKVLGDVQSLGARTLVLAGNGVSAPMDSRVVELPDVPPAWRAPLYLPVLQLMAYHRAVSKGLNPDRPTNLKAVVRLDG